jgi:hypothetical protein
MRPRLSGAWVGLALLVAVPLVLLASIPAVPITVPAVPFGVPLPVAARVPVMLGFVLFVPGAAIAHALALEDLLSFCVVALGVSVALLVVLSEVSLVTVGLSPPLVLGGLVVTTLAGVAVRTVNRIRAARGRRRSTP